MINFKINGKIFKFEFQLFYEKYLNFIQNETHEKNLFDILEKKNNSQLILMFDNQDLLKFQNKEIPANLK